MIIKKIYGDGTYAIFKLFDINLEFGIWWLKGFVIESDIDNIEPYTYWEFELTRDAEYEVIEV